MNNTIILGNGKHIKKCKCGNKFKRNNSLLKFCPVCYEKEPLIECSICKKEYHCFRPDLIKVAPVCSECFEKLPNINENKETDYLFKCKDCGIFYRGRVKSLCPNCNGNKVKGIGPIIKKYKCRDCGKIIESRKVNPECPYCGGNKREYKISCKKCGELVHSNSPNGKYLCKKCKTEEKENKKSEKVKLLEKLLKKTTRNKKYKW